MQPGLAVLILGILQGVGSSSTKIVMANNGVLCSHRLLRLVGGGEFFRANFCSRSKVVFGSSQQLVMVRCKFCKKQVPRNFFLEAELGQIWEGPLFGLGATV